MNFRVGQKVVCVPDTEADAQTHGRVWHSDVPKIGAIYTIIGFGSGYYGDYPVLLLKEIKNYINFLKRDVGYRASRFRPLVTRKTDISIFKRMLTPNQEKVRA